MSCRRATSDTTAPGANDSATIRPLSALFHRRRRPTPLRISTRPRGAEASTIWSTIYANRCHQLVRIFRTMPLAARWGKDTAYEASHRYSPCARNSLPHANDPSFAMLNHLATDLDTTRVSRTADW